MMVSICVSTDTKLRSRSPSPVDVRGTPKLDTPFCHGSGTLELRTGVREGPTFSTEVETDRVSDC